MNILRKLRLKKQNHGASFGKKTWTNTESEGVIESINPSNEKPIAKIFNCNASDYESIIEASEIASRIWRTVPAPKRGEVVRQIGERLREQKQYLGHLVTLETGKSLQEGLGEVQEMIDMADFAVGQSRMLYGKSMHSERPEHRMYEQWHPLGVVGVITAFNFPVAVWAWNAFIAAICGNTIVWKPSPKASLCALAVQHICNDIMAENDCTGVFSLFISDEIKLSMRFVNDRRIELISFTGSSSVGQKIKTVVSERMGKSLLECSGNNAIIVDETADLSLAIPAIVFGAVGTAGQRCTSTRRLFVHKSLYEAVKNSLVEAYSMITIGNPLKESNLMGPLIDHDAVVQYKKAINDIKQSGGRILFGGNVLEQPGFYVEPTLSEAHNEWPVVQRETFAPILYLMPFNTLEEAIALQNSVCQGLSSAIFTNSLKNAELFLSSQGSDCGIANVNIGTSGAEIGGAFGGEKATGGGREAGSDAWKAYMRRQTTTINWSSDLPLAQGISFSLKKEN